MLPIEGKLAGLGPPNGVGNAETGLRRVSTPSPASPDLPIKGKEEPPSRVAGRRLQDVVLDALLLARGVEGGEVKRLDQERRDAAVDEQVGDEPAREREQVARALGEQRRLQRVNRHAGHLEQAAVDQLDLEGD